MRRAVLPLLLACLCLTGCFRHDYFVSGTTPAERPVADFRHQLLWGLVDLNADVDLRAVCPQGVSRIESEMEFLNVAFALLTVGLYWSSTIDVFCQVPAPPPPAPHAVAPPAPAPAPPVSDLPIVEQAPVPAAEVAPAD